MAMFVLLLTVVSASMVTASPVDCASQHDDDLVALVDCLKPYFAERDSISEAQWNAMQKSRPDTDAYNRVGHIQSE